MDKKTVQSNILNWYDNSKRILPWRDNPNPYHVWISEIMLQQTRVEAVIPYFLRFIDKLPTISDLADVNDDILNKLWEGLGYYSRARNLKRAAQDIVESYESKLPSEYQSLISLPGIGPYTAGAILSIAFNKKHTAVDGNVLRVFSRVFGIKDDIKNKEIKQLIKNRVEDLSPEIRIGDFNQALMEVGATICKPNGEPLCSECPLRTDCKAYRLNLIDIIPKRTKKADRRIEKRTVYLITYNNLFAIEKRPSKGLLADLYQYPNELGHQDINKVKKQYSDELDILVLPSSKHIFTHLEWHMIAYQIELTNLDEKYLFVSKDDLISEYPIPTAFKTYTNYILESKKRTNKS